MSKVLFKDNEVKKLAELEAKSVNAVEKKKQAKILYIIADENYVYMQKGKIEEPRILFKNLLENKAV